MNQEGQTVTSSTTNEPVTQTTTTTSQPQITYTQTPAVTTTTTTTQTYNIANGSEPVQVGPSVVNVQTSETPAN